MRKMSTRKFHIFYDNFLSKLEEESLRFRLKDLASGLLVKGVEQYNLLEDKNVKDLAGKNLGLLLTANKLLDNDVNIESLPKIAVEISEGELNNINGESSTTSNVTGLPVDYSQLKPRGHYTKSDALEEYFKGTMYLSQVGYYAYDSDKPREDLTAMGMLLADLIYSDEELFNLYREVTTPMEFLVESTDDLSPLEYGMLLYGVHGREPDLNNLLDKGKMKIVYKEMEKLPKPQIASFKGYSFRLIPQRGVVDNVLMDSLLDINIPSKRPIVQGLDLMAILGSEKAKELQLSDPYNKNWSEYPTRLDNAISLAKVMDDKSWNKNLYRGWIWTLQELTNVYGEGYPSFMRNDAWVRKDLNSALGSYAELKHDTVLYGKQLMAEKGGGVDEVPLGYVEPNIRVYEKLSWLIEYTIMNLKERNLLTDEYLEFDLHEFKEMVDILADISYKELNNEPLAEEDYRFIYYIGASMENISVNFINRESVYWDLIDENNRKMAVVSDIMNVVDNSAGVEDGYLHLGVGYPKEIFAVYPVGDKLYMGRGGVFSYYEFIDETRLTDEEWREKLENNNGPEFPKWSQDLFKDGKGEIPSKYVIY